MEAQKKKTVSSNGRLISAREITTTGIKRDDHSRRGCFLAKSWSSAVREKVAYMCGPPTTRATKPLTRLRLKLSTLAPNTSARPCKGGGRRKSPRGARQRAGATNN